MQLIPSNKTSCVFILMIVDNQEVLLFTDKYFLCLFTTGGKSLMISALEDVFYRSFFSYQKPVQAAGRQPFASHRQNMVISFTLTIISIFRSKFIFLLWPLNSFLAFSSAGFYFSDPANRKHSTCTTDRNTVPIREKL